MTPFRIGGVSVSAHMGAHWGRLNRFVIKRDLELGEARAFLRTQTHCPLQISKVPTFPLPEHSPLRRIPNTLSPAPPSA